MAGNTHRPNCANAQNPGCECSGCGGSLHGWQGWTELALDTQQARDDRRRQLEGKVERNQRGALRSNARNRQAYIDLARLDIAGYLSAGPQPPESIDLADARAISSDLGRVRFLARAIMEDTWDDISKEIDNLGQSEQSAKDIKKQLADHTWCSLLVALIRCIEQMDDAVQALSATAKRFLTEHLSNTLTAAVVAIVVDRVWSALERLAEAHFPLLGRDTLRVLRMLALFACPSVDHHPAVYQHAARPLMGDARNVVSDGIRAQVGTLFAAWWRRRAPEAAA
jgi:hypothetical protein